MKLKPLLGVIILVPVFLAASCAANRPVLYPNSHLNTVGMRVADRDINACMSMAKNAGAETGLLSETAGETAEGAIIGGATGAAVGTVIGNPGTAAATGAAGGATSRFTRSILDSGKPDPVFRRFVDRCLRDKGYELVGWR